MRRTDGQALAKIFLCALMFCIVRPADADGPLRVAFIPPIDRSEIVTLAQRLSLQLGFQTRQLSPEEMIEPNVFAAEHFHAAIYTGGERYLYQVRRPGDAVSALMRYLGDGGTLIVAGICWPFYRPCRWDGEKFVRYTGPLPQYRGPRDEWLEQQMQRLRQNPTGTFNRFLGLNIAGEGTVQFERPPENDRIEFVLTAAGRKLFPSLPACFPFPTYGDLRFRPASGRNLGPGVEYVSVATAIGKSGKIYGDGICVVKHLRGPLAGGQVIYIWGTLLQGELARPLLLDALRLAARHAGIVAQAPASDAQKLAASLDDLRRRAEKIDLWPERSYFRRQAEALQAKARLAGAAAELGNAKRAELLLTDVRLAARLLRRRIQAAAR